jgi:two-component system response regulator HydG
MILIVDFSGESAGLWQQLGAELNVPVQVLAASDPQAVPGGIAVAILAAQGVEAEALEWLAAHEVPAGVGVLAVGSDPGRRLAIQFLSRGAHDYLALPEDAEILRNAVESWVARFRERTERRVPEVPAKHSAFERIVGDSPPLRAVLARAMRLARHPSATALIVGETGTGKELLARAIHEAGPRRAAPFVAVNCSALPAPLIESELFGHERGAFTDAYAAKPGLFELADGGTLFLDEVGTLPLELQAKLLRVLEDREVRRVGGTRSRRVDVRIMAACNERLLSRVRAGTFREDLYYRLSVVTLALPPLRERGDDVVLIARHLIRELAARHGLPEPPLTEAAQRRLCEHAWPGNVRELRNAIERAMLLSPEGTLDLGELVAPEAEEQPAAQAPGPLPFSASLDEMMAAAARRMVEACGGNRSEAARRLKISRPRLRRLLMD